MNVSIAGLESDALSLTIDANERTAIRNQITAKQGTLTIEKQRLLFLEQQGKFRHIFPLSIPQSPRCNPLPNLFRHLLITHSGSATTKGKNFAKSCRDVDSRAWGADVAFEPNLSYAIPSTLTNHALS